MYFGQSREFLHPPPLLLVSVESCTAYAPVCVYTHVLAIMHRSKSHAAALGGYVESLFCFVLFFGCCFGLRVPFAFLVFFLQNISLNLLYCGFRWQVWVLNIAWLLYVLQFRHSSFCVGVISFVIFHAFPVPSLHVPDVKRMFRNEKELYGVGFVDYEYEINNTNKKAALGRMFYPTAKKARSDPQEWNSYFFKAEIGRAHV